MRTLGDPQRSSAWMFDTDSKAGISGRRVRTPRRHHHRITSMVSGRRFLFGNFVGESPPL
ncbi:Ribonuclease Z [Clarias magur]|uniref:Ribonuclease Z n=1 Tax=Clarias magur TaxID=1594786 RepID=A0A8J4TRJ0_CLAMG|nr:Ribonuclease Z [Clarias magur]